MPTRALVVAEADGDEIAKPRAFKIALFLHNFIHKTISPPFLGFYTDMCDNYTIPR
jgi:hypothetical protein